MASSSSSSSISCCWKLAAALPLVLALIVYLGPVVIKEWDSTYGYTAPTYDDVPEEFLDEFRMYDTNGDGNIDPIEFVELMIKVCVVCLCVSG